MKNQHISHTEKCYVLLCQHFSCDTTINSTCVLFYISHTDWNHNITCTQAVSLLAIIHFNWCDRVITNTVNRDMSLH